MTDRVPSQVVSIQGPLSKSQVARIRNALAPESDQEATFLSGLGLIAGGFLLAQVIGSILYAPLSLVVPGVVLTFVGWRAKAPEGEE